MDADALRGVVRLTCEQFLSFRCVLSSEGVYIWVRFCQARNCHIMPSVNTDGWTCLPALYWDGPCQWTPKWSPEQPVRVQGPFTSAYPLDDPAFTNSRLTVETPLHSNPFAVILANQTTSRYLRAVLAPDNALRSISYMVGQASSCFYPCRLNALLPDNC